MTPGKPGCERRWCKRSMDGARRKVSAGGRKEVAVAERHQTDPREKQNSRAFLDSQGRSISEKRQRGD